MTILNDTDRLFSILFLYLSSGPLNVIKFAHDGDKLMLSGGRLLCYQCFWSSGNSCYYENDGSQTVL